MNEREPDADDVSPYLWDKSGEPDGDVKRLEDALAPLKHHAPLDWNAAAPRNVVPLRPRASRTVVVAVFAAALAAAAGAAIYLQTGGGTTVGGGVVSAPPVASSAPAEGPVVANTTPQPAERPSCSDPSRSGFRFRSTAGGTPRCDGGVAGTDGLVPKGAWLETDAATRVTLDVADIGRVEIDPGSRVRVVETNEEQHRLELGRGRLFAKIDAAPRLFFVDTKAATAVDLGCEYSIEVDEHGAGILKVTLGYVELEPPTVKSEPRKTRPAATLVPRGAECPIDPARGPGTPIWSRSAADTRASLAVFDRSGDVAALDRALAGLGARDSLTFFHLLSRVPEDRREAVLGKLEAIEKAPARASRRQTLALEPAAIQAWREALEARWFPK